MKYHVIGAFDRFNYGDILFARIIDDLLKVRDNSSNITYYSVSRSDMSRYGGVVTKSIKELENRAFQPEDVLLVAGGDVLTADWVTIITHSSGYAYYNFLRIIRKMFGPVGASTIARVLYGAGLEFPFVFSPDDFAGRPKVIYNAVGGSGFSGMPSHPLFPKIVDKLTAATSISVRDTQTYAYLKERGVPVHLRPDSASCMSLMYDRTYLEQYRPTPVAELSRYIVIQCALHVGKTEIENVIRRAVALSQEMDARIVLLPIGTAPAHDDDKFLKTLELRLSEAEVDALLLPQMHIFQIMATIAGAAAYAGSSLHGAITSLSYGVPAAALAPNKISKLTAYLDTWAMPTQKMGELTFYSAREPREVGAVATQPELALMDLKAHLGLA